MSKHTNSEKLEQNNHVLKDAGLRLEKQRGASSPRHAKQLQSRLPPRPAIGPAALVFQ
jgi:hypothetical protein